MCILVSFLGTLQTDLMYCDTTIIMINHQMSWQYLACKSYRVRRRQTDFVVLSQLSSSSTEKPMCHQLYLSIYYMTCQTCNLLIITLNKPWNDLRVNILRIFVCRGGWPYIMTRHTALTEKWAPTLGYDLSTE